MIGVFVIDEKPTKKKTMNLIIPRDILSVCGCTYMCVCDVPTGKPTASLHIKENVSTLSELLTRNFS